MIKLGLPISAYLRCLLETLINKNGHPELIQVATVLWIKGLTEYLCQQEAGSLLTSGDLWEAKKA